MGFPCGSAGKESACTAGDLGSIPVWGRSLEKGVAPVFWPGEFHGLYSSWGRKESDMTERLSLSLSDQDGGATALSPKNQPINSVMRIDGFLYLLILNIKQHYSWTSRDKVFHPVHVLLIWRWLFFNGMWGHPLGKWVVYFFQNNSEVQTVSLWIKSLPYSAV